MFQQCRFGTGVLSQGEVIQNPEQFRLVAKKAWLQLHDYFRLNDELIKAAQLPVPWSLEEDKDVLLEQKRIQVALKRFLDPDIYEKYIDESEWYHDDDVCDLYIAETGNTGRHKWIFDNALSINPKKILEVGVGHGEISYHLARKGYQVTGLSPNARVVDYLNKKAEKDKLPCEFVKGVFEEMDFGDRKFDVVIAGEILEHVRDDYSFLRKCCDLASEMVLVTTPVGCIPLGFYKDADWLENDQHVRAYSRMSLSRLLASVTDDFEIVGDVEKKEMFIEDNNGFGVYSFCARLGRIRKEALHGDEVRKTFRETIDSA